MIVMHKKVGYSPEVKLLLNPDALLKILQKTVDGYIESVPFDTPHGKFAVICNEEGRLRGLPFNCEIEGVSFVGDVVIAGMGEEDFTDLPEKAIKYLERVI